MTSEKKERAPTVRLKAPEVSLLWQALTEHCTRLEGMAVYEVGWSDERVAEVTERATASHVATMRLEHFGPLAPAAMAGGVQDLEKRLDMLSETVVRLAERVVAAEDRIAALERPALAAAG